MRVSLPLTAFGGRVYAAVAALGAVVVLAIGAAVAPQAHANFTLNKCQGAAIEGEGSSLQKLAQLNWISQIFDTEIYGGCGASAPKVTFTTASSGCGLDSVGAGAAAGSCKFGAATEGEWTKAGFRSANTRFGAADFAPTPEEEKNIDNGPTGAGTAGAGEVHVIPVAGAAITVVVHFPTGCVLKSPGTGTPASGAGTLNGDVSTGGVNDPTGVPTGDLYSNQTIRVHITDQKLEEIWQGQVTEWGQIVPEADFIGNASKEAGKAPAVCAKEPIYRIVRQDTSGTTYNFKHFLALLPSFKGEGGAKLWTSASSQVGNTNIAWPLSSATDVGTPPEVEPTGAAKNECNATVSPKHICHALEGSGGSLSNAVIATSGSIGYLDLATGREKGYNMTPNPTGEPGGGSFDETKNDRLYWIPLEAVTPPASESGTGTVDAGVFVEPTVDAKSHLVGGGETKGANCAGADYRGIPTVAGSPNGDITLADWSTAIATGGTATAIATAPTTAYPVCALTYDLAFDDDAKVYGNTPEEEAKARTVKDYLTDVVSNGQTVLPLFDYAVLPNEITEGAKVGVGAIGWNKEAGNGGKKEEVKKEAPKEEGKKEVIVTPPSNAFSVAGVKVKGKGIVLSLVLPGAGKVSIKASGGGVTVANLTASVSGGNGSVTLSISKAALNKLAKVKGHKFKVKITITFTPTGGTGATQTKTITLTQAATKGKGKGKSKGKGKKK